MPPQKRSPAAKPARERGGSRELILEAASEEFARNGYAGARIDAIAQRTALNVRMIYYHFGSKEGLYQAVLQAIYQHMAAVVDEPTPDADGAVEAFSRYIDLLGQNPRFADILVREAIDGGKRLGELFQRNPDLFQRLHRRAKELIEISIESGRLRPIDPALVVHSLTGMVCLLVASRDSQALFLEGRTVAPVEWKAVLMDLFLNGLGARGQG